jgi:hypothetical protein
VEVFNLNHNVEGGNQMRVTVLFVGLLFFVVAIPCKAQQHAPTVDVCSSDRALWYEVSAATEYIKAETEHMNNGIPNRTPYAKLDLAEVLARVIEMGACYTVDAERSDAYHEAQQFYASVYHDRVVSFISRHHLMEELKREDAQGQR